MQKKNEMPKQVLHNYTRFSDAHGIRFIYQGNFENGITEFAYRFHDIRQSVFLGRETVAMWRVKQTDIPLILRCATRGFLLFDVNYKG